MPNKNSIKLHIKNETATLKSVVLGIANQNGSTPKPEDCYDPKSKLHVLAGTYPKELDMICEMEAFNQVLIKYGVKVYRPEVLKDVNQIFARDIAFVIDDLFFKSNILPDRINELQAIDYVINQMNPQKVVTLPKNVHVEGGDVMPWNDFLFVGTYTASDYPNQITARTNKFAVDYLTAKFPNKIVKAFELRKSTNPKENALHLDCCFQPVGKDKAIIHKNGFLNEADYQFLIDLFEPQNVFEITKDEMFNMNSNVFSISEKVVVSENNFTRLNHWLKEKGFTVEAIPYAEIAKQEGLLRCSTLPLERERQ
ncbi:MAG: amidinotransferase [Flavobacteriales bacterium CG03_land_8_20_14_0_80_35_15]|nr:amidinotransferase [Zetaproteobacteria bacterium]PIV18604.1 MAG: amidinotransferase [Flavobacteriales bacterium CG03_land_8_20_14_0_80_35_15]